VKTGERDPKFAVRAAESVRRILAFKNKSATILRKTALPSVATVDKLSRKLWEFSEHVRLETLFRAENVSSKTFRGERNKGRTRP
jgi:hypothetical protein